MIFWASNDKGAGYASVIFGRSLTRQSLAQAVLVFGLVMVVVASFVTWSIALYSSFRIAGPLFRFSQNLKNIIENAFAIPMAIRQTDMLQHEWSEFEASQAALREHYGNLREALDDCEQSLAAGGQLDTATGQQAFARLCEVERRVQL